MINIDFDPTEHQTTWEDLQALQVIKTYLGDLSAWAAFDYFLCGDDTGECYAGSTASWDNNEGFDIILDENPRDELSFYVVAQWDDALDKPLFACPVGEPMTAHHLWKTL